LEKLKLILFFQKPILNSCVVKGALYAKNILVYKAPFISDLGNRISPGPVGYSNGQGGQYEERLGMGKGE